MQDIIEALIASGREGEYWDFKKQPHTDKGDLLHDIICLANSLSTNTKYLIIGVSDPAEDCRVVGLQKDTPDRKKSHHFNDFLRDKKFAGGYRPSVELNTLQTNAKEVDVLSIEDSPRKPYYLAEDFRGLRAYHIYTRVGDTNTPKNSSADIYHVERLWMQRFGIDRTPIERFGHLLDEVDQWNVDVGNREYAHHARFPEFQIRFRKTSEGWEPYSDYFPNPTSFFGTAELRYFSTVLKEIGYCGLDEFRVPIAVPEVELITIDGEAHNYCYYEQDSLVWKLSKLLGLYWKRHLKPEYWPFVVFTTNTERDTFNRHLSSIGKDLFSELREMESDTTHEEGWKKQKSERYKVFTRRVLLELKSWRSSSKE